MSTRNMSFEAPAQQKMASGNSLCAAVAAAKASADAEAEAREEENAWKDCEGDIRSVCVEHKGPGGNEDHAFYPPRVLLWNRLACSACHDGDIGTSLDENFCEGESEALTTSTTCNIDMLARERQSTTCTTMTQNQKPILPFGSHLFLLSRIPNTIEESKARGRARRVETRTGHWRVGWTCQVEEMKRPPKVRDFQSSILASSWGGHARGPQILQ